MLSGYGSMPDILDLLLSVLLSEDGGLLLNGRAYLFIRRCVSLSTSVKYGNFLIQAHQGTLVKGGTEKRGIAGINP
jgi:hypothetical protein